MAKSARSAKRRRILVTGGLGFIGSQLLLDLASAGHQVTVLDNLSFGSKKNLPKAMTFVKGDIRRPKDVTKALKGRRFDDVFHMAALHFIPYCNEHPDEAVSVNVEGTRVLLAALKQKPPERLFFASTAAVYSTSSRHHEESEMPEPMDIYGITKLAGEHMVRTFAHETDVLCMVGRLFNAYGPRETNPHLIPHILDQLKVGKCTLSLGNLAPYRDYVHTSDMTQLILNLTWKTKAPFAVYNIASGEEYSVKQVVKVFEKVLQKKLGIQSRAGLRRKAERMHLRAKPERTFRRAGIRPKVDFQDGLKQLLEEEGVLES